jgi:hypothetical protein
MPWGDSQRQQQEQPADRGRRQQAATEPAKLAQAEAGGHQQPGHHRERRVGDAVGQQPVAASITASTRQTNAKAR